MSYCGAAGGSGGFRWQEVGAGREGGDKKEDLH